jgi:peptidoglycan/xylan/chitin deacetylase (PgdA/CDA1 family)
MEVGLMTRLYVSFTMDCERIAAESPPGGPESWELSERAITGYCRALAAYGHYPTLFLTPECARQHAALLDRLAAGGVELGLHVHPQSLFDHRYDRYLGEYDAAMQTEILGRAAEAVAEAIGARPVSFRPGNFSANDDTLGVLYGLGFRQGSVSDPGRSAPHYAAVWEGAYPDPHYVDLSDKLAVGDTPFLEMPLTTDPDQRRPNGFPYELRVESGPFVEWHRPILAKTLRRFEEQDVAFRALSIFTHNYHEYSDADDARSVTLRAILDYIGSLSDYELVPVTLQQAHAHYRRVREQT